MQDIDIRRAVQDDALNLSVLKKQVFISTYALHGINEEFSNHITKAFSVNEILNNLKNPQKITLLAEKQGFLIGCAEIEINSTCKETNDSSPELTVLYVFEHAKGYGVGYALLSESEHIVKEMKLPGLWLTVYHKNFEAIKFYLRQSYKDIGKWGFEMEGKSYENRIMYKSFN